MCETITYCVKQLELTELTELTSKSVELVRLLHTVSYRFTHYYV